MYSLTLTTKACMSIVSNYLQQPGNYYLGGDRCFLENGPSYLSLTFFDGGQLAVLRKSCGP